MDREPLEDAAAKYWYLRGLLYIPAGLAAIAVMFGGAMLLRDTQLNAIVVPFAAAMLISYGFGVGLKLHHVIIWGGLLIAGALPVWSGADSSNAGLVLSGIAVIVSGLFDHRLFVRTFGPASLPARAGA